jgi:hypothetical protein
VSEQEPIYRYRFPKSRSKKLAKALDSARKLSGFRELDEYYEVDPSDRELNSSDFLELVNISEKWKGTSFFLGGREVSKNEFFKGPEPIVSQPEPEPVEASPSLNDESPSETAAEEGNGTEAEVGEQATTEADVPESAEEEPEQSQGSMVATENKPKKAENKPQKTGCACCWLPPSVAALLGLAIALLLS